MTDQTKPPVPVMARKACVAGFTLEKGHPLVVAADPKNPGEVKADDLALLRGRGLAVDPDQLTPTPVETADQAAVRLAAEAAREAERAPTPEPVAVKAEDSQKKPRARAGQADS